MDKNVEPSRLDKKKAAVCGLFCESCTFLIAAAEDPARLSKLAQAIKQPEEAIRCEGCRSQVSTFYCKTCKMYACAAARGVDFCVECSEYPCQEIKTFQSVLPHRIELWKSQDRIKEVGWEQWYREMSAHFSCSKCGTVNSAYDRACRKCGVEPGSEYVKVNQKRIQERMSKRG